jgi:hypothetical protein
MANRHPFFLVIANTPSLFRPSYITSNQALSLPESFRDFRRCNDGREDSAASLPNW